MNWQENNNVGQPELIKRLKELQEPIVLRNRVMESIPGDAIRACVLEEK